MSEVEVVTLSNVGDGAALELFQAAFGRVLENVADPNTDWKAKRKVTLEITVTPNEDRNASEIGIKCNTKLAGLKGVETYVHLGRHAGQLVAVENNPKQQRLFDEAPGIQPVAINGGKA
jgi:hypothetical protein